MSPIARLDGAGVSLGGGPVLRDVDFTLESGEVKGISGPNGSGKTTLIRLLATLVRPDGGSGEVLGAELNGTGIFAVRSSIGMIGHQPALIPELTLRENLVHVSRLSGAGESKLDQVLEVVGLDQASARRVEASSFGMKRRVEVAHLLLKRPRLILLDEANSGLDESAQDLIGALVKRATSDGGGVVMVSHDHDWLAGECDTVQTLVMGRLEDSV